MTIIIPMSGIGQRFIDAGYDIPKPLIKIDNLTIIDYVVNLFDINCKYIFICNDIHEKKYNLKKLLESRFTNSYVYVIETHKFGPVYAVSQIFQYLEFEKDIIVNYCDFYMKWNFNDFKQTIKSLNFDASIIAYTGFHPHLIYEKNLYAGCKIDENNNLIEIKEKFSFEIDKFKGHHSTGTYYFKNTDIMKYYFKHQLDNNITLNNEYYVSLCFNQMVKDNKRVFVYDKVEKFLQWGTPEDLNDYFYYKSIINKFI